MSERGSKHPSITGPIAFRRGRLPRLDSIRGSGVKMLLISNGVLLASLGLSGLVPLLQVFWRALRTPASVSQCRLLLVLGVKLKACLAGADYRKRLDRAALLWRRGGTTQIVLVGGRTSPQCDSEAAVGRNYLLHEGVDAGALSLEEHSLHTLENLRRIRQMYGAQPGATVVTNRYHVARASAIAKGLALSLEFCAAETHLLPTPMTLLKLLLEAYYLHWYYCGRFWARLARDHNSLEHIE